MLGDFILLSVFSYAFLIKKRLSRLILFRVLLPCMLLFVMCFMKGLVTYQWGDRCHLVPGFGS